MRGKAIWAALGCMTAAALLISCAPVKPPATAAPPTPSAPASPTTLPASPASPATPTKATTPTTSDKPKYGGTFTAVYDQPPVTFDDAFVSTGFAYILNMTNEGLLTGDWAKGPAGTGEVDFQWPLFAAETGCLAESWEVPDPNTIIYNIRKGVHWALNPQSEASKLLNGRSSLPMMWSSPGTACSVCRRPTRAKATARRLPEHGLNRRRPKTNILW